MTDEGLRPRGDSGGTDPVLGRDDDLREHRAMSTKAWEVVGGIFVAIIGLAAVVLSQTLSFKDGDAADILGLLGFLLFLMGGCSAL